MATKTNQKKTTQKKAKPSASLVRTPIESTRNYTRPEAAIACGVSEMTLIRAFQSEHLKAYRIGRRVIHSGAQLQAWMEAGGKTGWDCVDGVPQREAVTG
jgi:hypothetical protein